MKSILILFLIYSFSGTLLHYLFKISNYNIVVGMFASVNESVWEHIKILLTPIFLVSFISFLITKNRNLFGLFIELLLGIILIVLFYEIKIILFKDKYGFINIIIFYITCLILSIIHYLLGGIKINSFINSLSIIPVVIILSMYLTFSIFPPKNKYFKDPVTGSYGINRYVNKSV